MTGRQQLLDEIAGDEASRTSHQDLHRGALSVVTGSSS
jgi:hypothetical protein